MAGVASDVGTDEGTDGESETEAAGGRIGEATGGVITSVEGAISEE